MIPFEIESSWRKELENELNKPYISSLAAFVERERGLGAVFPPKELVFNAFLQTPYDKVKILIMGQDPYHGPGQAHGLSFSVPAGVPAPPSLQNIYKELASDIGMAIPNHGCLLNWTKQGVMLLNASLTVRQGEPQSHAGKGWEMLTDGVIEALARRKEPIIFVLWGKSAQDKGRRLVGTHHPILKAPHPSPLSAHQGFFGCKHFSKVNALLQQQGNPPIDWSL